MTLYELRDEFDWMSEFMGRMAERIRDDKDVHNLADYVHKIEDENTKLRELIHAAWRCIHTGPDCYDCRLIAGGCTLQSAMRELGIEVKP